MRRLVSEILRPKHLFARASDHAGKTISEYVQDSRFKGNPQFLCESFEPIKALAKNSLGIAMVILIF